MGVGSIVMVILCYALVQGVWIFRANESELWARSDGSAVIREIQDSLQSAQAEKIYADYTQVGGVDGNNGSCAVITRPDLPAPISYYWWLPPGWGASQNLGKISSHMGSTAPDPTTDPVLAADVMSFEFRRNPNGTVRVGFVFGILGYPRRLYGSIEADRLRFTTSSIPRNP